MLIFSQLFILLSNAVTLRGDKSIIYFLLSPLVHSANHYFNKVLTILLLFRITCFTTLVISSLGYLFIGYYFYPLIITVLGYFLLILTLHFYATSFSPTLIKKKYTRLMVLFLVFFLFFFFYVAF